MKQGHRRSLLRNQVMSLILYGHINTTTARAKEVRRIAERLVTIARKGNDFNTVRRVKQQLPYSETVVRKLIGEIAPRYVDRPGGYLRTYYLGRRESDTSAMSRLEWV
jgi:large subunit ribosomal protein L17